MTDGPSISRTTSNVDDWKGVVSTGDGDGPTLVTFGRRRSSNGGDRIHKQLSAASLLFGTEKSMEERSSGSRGFSEHKSQGMLDDPASAVKRAMRAKAAKTARLPLIYEINEDSADEGGDTPLVEISLRRKASDREGRRQADIIYQSVLADTPEADSYVPYGYGSFRVETGKLGADGKPGKSRLPDTLPTLPSTDFGSETEEEGEHSGSRRVNRDETNFTEELSSASSSVNRETMDTSRSSISTTTENGEGRKSSSLYKALRGRSIKGPSSTMIGKSLKTKTQFVTNIPQNTLMSDLTTILETKFCCGVQRKKNELRVAVSLNGEASALVIAFSGTKSATVIVSLRKSKVDRSKVPPEAFLNFFQDVKNAFENMHGKGALIDNDKPPR